MTAASARLGLLWCFAALFLACGTAVTLAQPHVPPVQAGARGDAPPDVASVLRRIREIVAKLQLSPPRRRRDDLARQLFDLSAQLPPSTAVDRETLSGIVGLLSLPVGQARDGVIATLGNLGPQAKPAVGPLLALLAQTDCETREGDDTPMQVRMTLGGIRAPIPPYACYGARQPGPTPAGPGRASAVQVRIVAAIREVHAAPSPTARSEAAEQVADLVRSIRAPEQIDDRTIESLIGLLCLKDDGVRLWVSGALGRLGVRAIAAAPVILRLLPGVDCQMADLNSASSLRVALRRMGVNPPPPSCAAR